MCKFVGCAERLVGMSVGRERNENRKIARRELFQKKSDFWNAVAGDVRELLSLNAMHTHEFGEKGRLRGSSPQFWMLQLSIGEAIRLADCAHANVAVDEVASGSQGLAIDFEQIEFLDLGLEYAHRRVRQ